MKSRRNIISSILLACVFAAACAPARAGFLFWGGEKPSVLEPARELFARGDYAGSAELFEAALASPAAGAADKKLAYWFLGQCHERAGKDDRALSDYQIAVRIYPKDMQLLLALGRLYQKTGLLDNAQAIFLKILNLDSGSFEANIGLAQIYMKEGFHGKAEKHYSAALESMAVRDAALWRGYAESAFAQRKYEAARGITDRALAMDSGDAETLLLSARIYGESGDKTAALAEIARAQAAAPERSDIVLRRALWLAASGDTDKSLALSQAELIKRPDDPLASLAAALAYMKSGRPALARPRLLAAAESKEEPFIARAALQLLKTLPE
ncbi:MAG: tetratricopeptide repeat protein [Elusimicrobiales bacterium]